MISMCGFRESAQVSITNLIEVAMQAGSSLLECFVRPVSEEQLRLFEGVEAHYERKREVGARQMLASAVFRRLVLSNDFCAIPPVADFAKWMGVSRLDANFISENLMFEEKNIEFLRNLGRPRSTLSSIFRSGVRYCVANEADEKAVVAHLGSLYRVGGRPLEQIALSCLFITACMKEFEIYYSGSVAVLEDYRKSLDRSLIDLRIEELVPRSERRNGMASGASGGSISNRANIL